MEQARRRVWRASRTVLVLVSVFALVCLIGLPALALVSWRSGHDLWVPVLLAALALLGLLYCWRFALHPRIIAGQEQLVIKNPLRTHRFSWQEIAVVQPGANGLIVAGPEFRAEAWCVQKSARDLRHERPARADRIGDEVWEWWQRQHPPIEVRGQYRILRARPGLEVQLAALERSASIDALGHIFPGQRFPFPIETVTERWRDVLQDPSKQTFVARTVDPGTSQEDRPIGVVAHSANAVLHLAVAPDDQRHGCGAMLLRCAEAEIFGDPNMTEASLWVLEDNLRAVGFYSDHGWRDTDNRRRSPYPPKPPELRMIKSNPRAARRSRTSGR